MREQYKYFNIFIEVPCTLQHKLKIDVKKVFLYFIMKRSFYDIGILFKVQSLKKKTLQNVKQTHVLTHTTHAFLLSYKHLSVTDVPRYYTYTLYTQLYDNSIIKGWCVQVHNDCILHTRKRRISCLAWLCIN